VLDRAGHWRVRGECDIEDEYDHHEAEDFGEAVHGLAGFFEKENRDGYCGAEDGARLDRKAGHGFDTEARAGHIADVKSQSTAYDEECQEVTETREKIVCQILGPFAGYGDDLPDVELDGEVDQNRYQNDKAETGRQLFGEDGRLRQKAGAYCRSGHEECGAQQGVFVLCHIKI
jgi:hypothetical protein